MNLPPLNKKHPLIRNPPLGGTNIVTINLDGGTITPLIRNPPSEVNIVSIKRRHYQFRRRGGFLLGGVLIRGGDYILLLRSCCQSASCRQCTNPSLIAYGI